MAETGSQGVDVEGGGRGDENPFSFKSFVKRASTGGPGAEGEQGKGGKRERGRGRKARPATTLGSEGDVPFPEEGKDNPFSFKQFVRKQTLSQVSDGSSSSDGEHSLSNSLERAPGPLAPDSPTLPLPATVTTAAPPPSRDKNKLPKKPKSTSRNSQPLPSTSTTIAPSASGTITGGKDSKKSVSTKEKNRRKDKLFSDSESDSDIFTNTGPDLPLPFPADVSPTGVGVSGGDPLGTFGGGGKEEGGGERRAGVLLLSDSSEDCVVMVEGRGKAFPGVQSVEPVSEELRTLNSQLSAENERLKSELESYKEKYRKEKQKNSRLGVQLQALKKKEAEETKALEDIVAKVEENLVASTKRAMTAEVAVSRLKQEMLSIQAQLSQADAQSVHRHYEELLSGVRDKASFASRQLSVAAMAADQSIRELLSGVDTLKNVAETMEFIDRISEVRQH